VRCRGFPQAERKKLKWGPHPLMISILYTKRSGPQGRSVSTELSEVRGTKCVPSARHTRSRD
jgi:hypothetical protein